MTRLILTAIATFGLMLTACVAAEFNRKNVVIAADYGPRTSATLNLALSKLPAGVESVIAVTGGRWDITNNVLVPSRANMYVTEVSFFFIATNVTFRLSGGDFNAGRQNVFQGPGTANTTAGVGRFDWRIDDWGSFTQFDIGLGDINIALTNQRIFITNYVNANFAMRLTNNLTINIDTNDTIQDIQDVMLTIGVVDAGVKLIFQWTNGVYNYPSPLDFFGNIGGAGQVCLLGNTNDPTQVKVNFTNDTDGFVVMDNGTINLLDGFEVIGVNTSGVQAAVFSRNSSSLNVGSNMIVHDFHFGFAASQAGELLCIGATVFDCFVGVIATLNGTLVADGMFIGTNAVGVQGGGSSFIRITGATITNNTLGLTANFNGFIRADGTITNGNTTATFPVTNVVGNTQGFISRLP
ncbi:MAG: hypothetical protein IH951_11855 [Bacteroidetes bacterium]|nr:hypothetical protein [Bacteroidota bacterium]